METISQIILIVIGVFFICTVYAGVELHYRNKLIDKLSDSGYNWTQIQYELKKRGLEHY